MADNKDTTAMPGHDGKPCDVEYLNYRIRSLTMWFVGLTVASGMFGLVVSLVILIITNNHELAITVGVINGISNVISLGIGVLVPSPIQSSARRTNDYNNSDKAPQVAISSAENVNATSTTDATPDDTTPDKKED